ncbi:hypothetical protein JD844_010913 [Phrynosoma platyrhinos]|uniref:Grh/CP2 DB domain-containing protein n=1 Tax=Phrynosoma platyrhinos TaxID=52577 RepID=A0ABQ7TIY3_PHRPL|nr:hypothetical protein JD844_010913 [Phrynosoma platyrhinos]
MSNKPFPCFLVDFLQVHCISTEFTMRKHGGEKGVPFRVQIDTFKENENGEYTEHLHSASCQIKVFKLKQTSVECLTSCTPCINLTEVYGFQPKGADRKQKTDREKMEKRTPHEKEKYQPSYETTILTECSPWPEITYVNNVPSPGFSSSHSSFSISEGNGSPNHQPEPPAPITDNLLPTSTPQEAQQWLHRNRFSTFSRLFTNFSGSSKTLILLFSIKRKIFVLTPISLTLKILGADLLKLTREDVIQICGPADGIRLFNALKGRCVLFRLALNGGWGFMCQVVNESKIPASLVLFFPNEKKVNTDRYQMNKSQVSNKGHIFLANFGILTSSFLHRMVRPRLTIYVCQESQQLRDQQKHEDGDAANSTFFVYHAIYLEELTAVELTEKIAQLFSISAQQISQIYKQGPTGIHVLISDEVRLP